MRAMSASADAVNDALGQYLRSVQVNKGKAVRAISLQIVSDIQKKTPVDTGRARAAWSPAVRSLGGTPAIGRAKSIDAKQVARGEQEGFGLFYESPDRAQFQATNGVRYVPFLEAGASPQAPYGFVRRTLDDHADALLDAIGRTKTEGTR